MRRTASVTLLAVAALIALTAAPVAAARPTSDYQNPVVDWVQPTVIAHAGGWATVHAQYTCFGGNEGTHVYIGVKQGPQVNATDHTSSQYAETFYSTNWNSDSGSNALVCDGHKHNQRFTVKPDPVLLERGECATPIVGPGVRPVLHLRQHEHRRGRSQWLRVRLLDAPGRRQVDRPGTHAQRAVAIRRPPVSCAPHGDGRTAVPMRTAAGPQQDHEHGPIGNCCEVREHRTRAPMPTKSSMPPPVSRTPRPGDATLSVTKAARVLGVHPNTVRAWSEAGRLRYYRINDRGDRRYRLNDLQRFLAAAESGAPRTPSMPARPEPRSAARRDSPPTQTLTESTAGLDLLADLAEVASLPAGLDPALDEACRRIRLATGAALVGIWERRPGGLVPRATDVEGPGITATRGAGQGRSLFTLALESAEPIHARPGTDGPAPVLGMGTDELVVRIPGGESPWGILVLAGAMELGPDDGAKLAGAIARTLGVLIRGASATEQATSRLRRSEALRRVATDLASRLDVGDVVRDLSDHARVLFGADRVAVVLRDPEGRISSPGGTGFSDAFLAIARDLEGSRTGTRDIPPRRPVLLLGPEAPRSASPVRAAAVQEGVDTLLAAPLVDGHELHGVLYLAHDRPHRWREGDLDGAEALAGDAAIAVRSARTFGRMAAWAAQLQSIQRLGARLSGLSDVAQIGHAIATELRQLIDYENARVYRVRDESLVPVAMQGSGAVYADENPDSLIVAVGEGITGWVARFRVPQLVDDTANDPRAVTIPGTEEDLDESMLLAPMVHEGVCLGVVVLSKLGLRQFTEDDLRLLVIYASFAAQAMANADSTQRLRQQSDALERQLLAQQALMRTTESILTTLDQRQVLDQITDRWARSCATTSRSRSSSGRPASSSRSRHAASTPRSTSRRGSRARPGSRPGSWSTTSRSSSRTRRPTSGSTTSATPAPWTGA